MAQSYRGGAAPFRDKTRTYILPGRRAHNFERNFEGLEKDNESFGILAEKMSSLGIEDPTR